MLEWLLYTFDLGFWFPENQSFKSALLIMIQLDIQTALVSVTKRLNSCTKDSC